VSLAANTRSHAGIDDVAKVRADFRSWSEVVHGKPLVYLDNAARRNKPRAVLDAVRRYYGARQRQRAPAVCTR